MKLLSFSLLFLIPAAIASPLANPTKENGKDGSDETSGGLTLGAVATLDTKHSYDFDFDALLQLAGKHVNATADGDAAINDEELKLYVNATAHGKLGKRQSPTASTIGNSLRQQMLAYHNGWRAHHGAAAMTWNTTMSVAALRSASKCVFAHTSNNPYGENIAAGTPNNPAWYAWLWYNEVNKYDYNNPGFSSATGHFTQVVWKNSKQLGCAFVSGCTGR
ncbi:Natrin-2 [Dactylella cylindrospora]|nr:Natrin-2 [Dactylella cylindrospora]